MNCANIESRRVAHPFAFLLLTRIHNCMMPLQYVNAEELVQFFRVADPFGSKGSGFGLLLVASGRSDGPNNEWTKGGRKNGRGEWI